MSLKKIREKNDQCFLDDIHRVTQVMVYVCETDTYLTVTKKEVKQEAIDKKIIYRLTRDIFRVKREVMVIY